MAFDLSDYVDVAERIREFRDKYPDGSLQSEIVASPIEGFVIVKAFAYRTPDDLRPGVGHAWEVFPGRTPYTKDSELQNAETSAWGRSIVAVGAADTKRGIASKQEVQNRSGGKANSPPSGQTTDAPSPSSTTPSSDAGVEESDVLGKDGASTPPVSDHAHDWVAAPRAGFQRCAKCGAARKGSA